MTPSWHLEDADPIAASAKYTFYKPSRRIISQLQPGNLCKLNFRFESADPKHPAAERMWVIIDEITFGKFSGRLENQPYYIKDLACDDPIFAKTTPRCDARLPVIRPANGSRNII